MSEDEIIEIIEKLQCEYKEQQNDKKYNDYTVFKATEYSKGLQGLLDLYNKEKEKNKKCEYYEMVADELYKNSISKDKIKEKIEELNSIYQQEIKQKYNGRYYHQLSYAIQILKELEGDK